VMEGVLQMMKEDHISFAYIEISLLLNSFD